MGTARYSFFTVSSILLLISAISGLVLAIVTLSERLGSNGTSNALTFLSCSLIVIYSLINLYSGIKGIQSRNVRTNSAIIIRLPEAAVLLGLITIIIALFNGMIIWQLAGVFITGLLIPVLFICASIKKSYTG